MKYLLQNSDDLLDGGGGSGKDWKASLPDDIKADPSLATIPDIPTLAKNYISTKKAFGSDKIVIPGKDATDAQWSEIHQKLGLPKEVTDYKFDLEVKDSVEEAFLSKFREAAHKAGVLPRQAKAVADFIGRANREAYDGEVSKIKEGMTKLTQDWGAKNEENLTEIKKVINQFTTPEEREALKSTSLGTNPGFLRMMVKIAGQFKEGAIKGGGDTSGKITPAQAKERIKEITGNPSSPYFNPKHDDHKKTVKEVTDLFAMAHPSGVSQQSQNNIF